MTTQTTPGTFVPVRKMQFSPLATAAGYALLWGLLVPLIKLLELFGLWPKIMIPPKNRKQPESPGFGDYRPTAHDVIACVGFKSGTHWVMQMTLQIAHRGNATYDHIYDLIAWPDQPPAAPQFSIPVEDETPWQTSPTGLRVIKTHLAASHVPYSPDAKYIAVVRDPKDVCVSAWHFYKDLFLGPMAPPAEGWVDVFLNSPIIPQGWAEHVATWWQLRARPNVLFMTYEDMKADPHAAVVRVAEFMGVKLTDQELVEVERLSSFSYMKQIASKFDWVKLVPWATPEGATVRKGEKGKSAEFLSADLREKIDQFCGAELTRVGCDFPYEDYYGSKAVSPKRAA